MYELSKVVNGNRPSHRLSRMLALSATLVVLAAQGVTAGEVTLRTKGGDFSIVGEIRGFDGAKYTIQSKSLGAMTLDAARFDCVGADCPKGPLAASEPAAQFVASGGPARISVSGSNTIGNQLMPALVTAFATSNKLNLTKVVGDNPLDLQLKLDNGGRDVAIIDLHRHGSATAFRDLEAHTADIGMASRQVKAEEAAKLVGAGLPDVRQAGSEHILGLDGLEILVSPNNKLVSISVDNVAKIFSGQITDWSALGLPAGPINVYAPTPDSGTFETFVHLVLAPRKLELTKSAKRTENHAEQSDWVARDPNGIGFAGIAYQRNAKPLNIEVSCGLITVPSVFSMKTEEYPLSRRLYLYTAGEPRQPLAKSLLDFVLSPSAQPVVKQNDFIDQSPELIGYEAQASRIANAFNAPAEDFNAELMKQLTSDLKGAQRLSATFRFQTASFALDNKALADISRLTQVLKTAEFNKREILLVGFADSRGEFGNNLRLSERRARSVLNAINAGERAGGAFPRIQLKAYSELAPVACNDSEDGRQYNRRVEVWVK